MKTVQKLEFLAGLAALTTAILSFYFVHIPIMERSNFENSTITESLIGSFLVFLFPLFLMLIGVYVHIARQNIVGFIIVLVFGSLLILSHAFGFLVGTSFNNRVLLGVSPGLCALVTVILAICSTLLAPPNQRTVRLR